MQRFNRDPGANCAEQRGLAVRRKICRRADPPSTTRLPRTWLVNRRNCGTWDFSTGPGNLMEKSCGKLGRQEDFCMSWIFGGPIDTVIMLQSQYCYTSYQAETGTCHSKRLHHMIVDSRLWLFKVEPSHLTDPVYALLIVRDEHHEQLSKRSKTNSTGAPLPIFGISLTRAFEKMSISWYYMDLHAYGYKRSYLGEFRCI